MADCPTPHADWVASVNSTSFEREPGERRHVDREYALAAERVFADPGAAEAAVRGRVRPVREHLLVAEVGHPGVF